MAPKNPKTGQSLNPQFDQRMLSIGSPTNGGKALRRGWIATDNTTTPPPPLPGRVNFLFNPPQVQVSHPLNPNYQSSDYRTMLDAYSAQWVGDTLGQAGEVGLSLLFDRTYELWDKSKASSPAGQYGAYVDVLAFYKLLGIVSSQTVHVPPTGPGIKQPGDINTFVEFGLFPQNPLSGNPICYLYLGPNSLKFRGFVDNFNVTYTHFSRQMVPMRVQIDMSMQMYFQPSAEALGGTAGTGINGGPGSGGSYYVPPAAPPITYPPSSPGTHQPGNGTHWGPVLP